MEARGTAGCLSFGCLAAFLGLAAAAFRAVDHSIRKAAKGPGVVVSILLGGVSIGLGYLLAYVGWTESEVERVGSYDITVTYQYTHPVVGWIGIVIGGLVVVGGIYRTLTVTKQELELEESAKKPKEDKDGGTDRGEPGA